MFDKILVCLDGSKFAERILPHAIERARYFKSRLTLLRVVSINTGAYTTPILGDASLIMPEVMDSIIHGEEKKAKAYLNSVVLRLSKMALEVDAVVLHKVANGTIGSTIANYAEVNEADLIMIASHGYKGWKRLLLGSIAESVIENAASPVLVIKPQGTTAQVDTFTKKSEAVTS